MSNIDSIESDLKQLIIQFGDLAQAVKNEGTPGTDITRDSERLKQQVDQLKSSIMGSKVLDANFHDLQAENKQLESELAVVAAQRKSLEDKVAKAKQTLDEM